jgi:hypothetical protein
MSDATHDSDTVRRFEAADAPGVVALVRRIYGDDYSYRDELYHANEILRQNQSGALIAAKWKEWAPCWARGPAATSRSGGARSATPTLP